MKPFTLYAPFSGKQGVFGQDMLPYTHWLQQSHPHSLTADDGLVDCRGIVTGCGCQGWQFS